MGPGGALPIAKLEEPLCISRIGPEVAPRSTMPWDASGWADRPITGGSTTGGDPHVLSVPQVKPEQHCESEAQEPPLPTQLEQAPAKHTPEQHSPADVHETLRSLQEAHRLPLQTPQHCESEVQEIPFSQHVSGAAHNPSVQMLEQH